MTERTKNRLAALRSKMAEHGVDLVALGPGSHMHWVLGFHPHPDERPCLLLVGKQKEAFLMPVLNAEGSRESTDIGFHTWSDAEGPNAALRAALADIAEDSAGHVVVDETMRADFALPANLVEGDYRVRIFLTREGRVIDHTEQIIAVRKEGLERFLYNLAHDMPLVYGILALLIAALAGWGASAGFSLLRR